MVGLAVSAESPPDGESLVVVEALGFDEGGPFQREAKFLHGTHRGEPVEQLLLAGMLDVGQGHRQPRVVFGGNVRGPARTLRGGSGGAPIRASRATSSAASGFDVVRPNGASASPTPQLACGW